MALSVPRVTVSNMASPSGMTFDQSAQNLLDFLKPKVDQSTQGFARSVGQINNLRSLTPQQMSEVAGDPSAVTAALGFNTPTELLGMSPEEYQSMVAPKESFSQILSRNLDLADKVTGMPELRKNAFDVAQATNAANLGMATAAGQGGLESQRMLDTATNAQNLERARLDVTAQDANAKNKIAGATLDLAREKAATEQRYYNAAIAAANQGAQGMPADKKYYDLLQAQSYNSSPELYIKGKDNMPTGVNWGEVESYVKAIKPGPDGKPIVPGKLATFSENHMKMLAVGQPYKKVLELGLLSKPLGGWNAAYLTPQGWYGVNVKDGVYSAVSPSPIVTFGTTASQPAKIGSLYNTHPGLSATGE